MTKIQTVKYSFNESDLASLLMKYIREVDPNISSKKTKNIKIDNSVLITFEIDES